MRIVTYHYVRDGDLDEWPELPVVPVRAFREQIKYLKRTGRIVGIEEMVEKISRQEEMDDGDTLLTFDDGYFDHWKNVRPALQREDVKGLFFIPTRAIKERRLTETNKVQMILGRGTEPEEIISELKRKVEAERDRYRLRGWQEYLDLYERAGRFDSAEVKFVKNMLQFGLPNGVREVIVDEMFGQYVPYQEQEIADAWYMTADQVCQMHTAGMDIGNHGLNHVWLDKLTYKQQEEEIKGSLRQLGEMGINSDNWTMCYPYGAYNEDTKKLLVAYGCAAGFSTKGGITPNNLASIKYEINRLDANDVAEEMNETMHQNYNSREFQYNC